MSSQGLPKGMGDEEGPEGVEKEGRKKEEKSGGGRGGEKEREARAVELFELLGLDHSKTKLT